MFVNDNKGKIMKQSSKTVVLILVILLLQFKSYSQSGWEPQKSFEQEQAISLFNERGFSKAGSSGLEGSVSLQSLIYQSGT
jgi:hypothetical protein